MKSKLKTKKLIILILLLVYLVVGVYWYMVHKDNKQNAISPIRTKTVTLKDGRQRVEYNGVAMTLDLPKGWKAQTLEEELKQDPGNAHTDLTHFIETHFGKYDMDITKSDTVIRLGFQVVKSSPTITGVKTISKVKGYQNKDYYLQILTDYPPSNTYNPYSSREISPCPTTSCPIPLTDGYVLVAVIGGFEGKPLDMSSDDVKAVLNIFKSLEVEIQ